ncbi:GNAT family N-acetyltransferase [uncultured Methanobrevibacter sp.]|uniref:GNAT family N-acetyltransferase n=1 Tax=uncultured Methanobrevibacter sp. TaxID=253161 RepID=UPI0025E1436D|nr:GNAT family N-acetyltransferase [uncultured Methanobrevibacter sp.]
MKYMNFNPQIHDVKKIATLKYNVDFRTYNKFYKSKEKAIKAIEKTLKEEDCIKVIYDNENIIGMLVAYNHENEPEFHFKSLKLLIIAIMDNFVICNLKKDDLYIAEIAIDEKQQSKGYGTKVINDVINYAKKNNYKRVILDADFRNPKAKALYERVGFKVYNKKSFLKRGMYNMEYKI